MLQMSWKTIFLSLSIKYYFVCFIVDEDFPILVPIFVLNVHFKGSPTTKVFFMPPISYCPHSAYPCHNEFIPCFVAIKSFLSRQLLRTGPSCPSRGDLATSCQQQLFRVGDFLFFKLCCLLLVTLSKSVQPLFWA